MARIKVIEPFALRLSSEHKRRSLGRGIHEVSQAELDHWFLKDCLASGRAVLLAEEKEAKAAPTQKSESDPVKKVAAKKTPAKKAAPKTAKKKVAKEKAPDVPSGGKVIEMTDEEIQAGIYSGELIPITREELLKASLEDLIAMAEKCGHELAPGLDKERLISLLLPDFSDEDESDEEDGSDNNDKDMPGGE